LKPNALEQKFDDLITANASMILKVCRMYTSNGADRQDLYQEIVLQLWKAYPGYRGDAKFSTWLYRVAINTAITGLQKQARRISTDPIEQVNQELITVAPPAEHELLPTLYEAIGQLNDIERAIVMLYVEDFSYDEMENILGITEATLRVKMNRIKQKLKKLTHTL
jgi:RNA polymerase sigma-70 factor (ECF subfamily)